MEKEELKSKKIITTVVKYACVGMVLFNLFMIDKGLKLEDDFIAQMFYIITFGGFSILWVVMSIKYHKAGKEIKKMLEDESNS